MTRRALPTGGVTSTDVILCPVRPRPHRQNRRYRCWCRWHWSPWKESTGRRAPRCHGHRRGGRQRLPAVDRSRFASPVLGLSPWPLRRPRTVSKDLAVRTPKWVASPVRPGLACNWIFSTRSREDFTPRDAACSLDLTPSPRIGRRRRRRLLPMPFVTSAERSDHVYASSYRAVPGPSAHAPFPPRGPLRSRPRRRHVPRQCNRRTPRPLVQPRRRHPSGALDRPAQPVHPGAGAMVRTARPARRAAELRVVSRGSRGGPPETRTEAGGEVASPRTASRGAPRTIAQRQPRTGASAYPIPATEVIARPDCRPARAGCGYGNHCPPPARPHLSSP